MLSDIFTHTNVIPFCNWKSFLKILRQDPMNFGPIKVSDIRHNYTPVTGTVMELPCYPWPMRNSDEPYYSTVITDEIATTKQHMHIDETYLSSNEKCSFPPPGPRPTNGISIEFEIRSEFGVLLFKTCSIDHNEILHTSRQCNCRDVCKILSWSMEYILNHSTSHLGRISNSIEISLVGRGPLLPT